MATILRRGNRCEIRECIPTPRGPRNKVLAVFSGALTSDVIEEARERASRPLNDDELIRRAKAKGIPFRYGCAERELRALISSLRRRRDGIDPRLVSVLRGMLDEIPGDLPRDFLESSQWVGVGPQARAASLQKLCDELSPISTAEIQRLSGLLFDLDIPHAFGGRFAAGYYGVPRPIGDIDVNIFLRTDSCGRVLDAATQFGADVGSFEFRRAVAQDAQVRVPWKSSYLDFFFSFHDIHENASARARQMPFGDGSVRVLSAEDIIIFKALFDRPKDWVDVREAQFALGGKIDAHYVLEQVAQFLDESDSRVEELREILRVEEWPLQLSRQVAPGTIGGQ